MRGRNAGPRLSRIDAAVGSRVLRRLGSGMVRKPVALLLVMLATCSSAAAQLPAEKPVPAENPVSAENAVPQAPAETQTVESAERRLKNVDQLTELDDAARAEIRSIWQEVLQELTAARDFAAQEAVWAKRIEQADENQERARAQLSAAPAPAKIDIPPNATLTKLEELLHEEEKKLDEARRHKEQLDQEQARRQSRRAEIPERQGALKELQGALENELNAALPGTGPKAEAVLARVRARITAAQQEKRTAERELAAYSATTDLLPLELDLANREVSLAEKRIAAWRQAVEERRAVEVQRQAEVARLEAATTTGPLQALAVRSAEMAKRSGELLDKIQAVNRDLDNAKTLLERTRQQAKSMRGKVEQVGLNYAIGLLLRQEDANLPDVRDFRRNSRERERRTRDVQLQIIDLAEERAKLTNVDFVETFLNDLESRPTWLTDSDLERAVRGLVDTQLQALSTLQQNLDAYFQRLVELESTERQLVSVVSDYEQYIDEHVLWIQSSDPLSWRDFQRCLPAVQVLGDATRWWNLVRLLGRDLAQWLFPAVLFGLVWLAWLLAQPRLRRAITRLGHQAASGSCRRFSVTLVTLLWTVLIAALWPTLIQAVSWRLGQLLDSTGFAKMVSAGLQSAAILYIVLELLRQVCRPHGLADAHFHWPAGVRQALRHNLRWLMIVTLPLVFFAALLNADVSRQSPHVLALGRTEESLSRLCTIGALIVALVFVQRVLRPEGLLFRSLQAAAPDTRLYRFRVVWYGLAFAGLSSLLMLSVIGYHYTVWQLVSCLLRTVLLIEFLFVAGAIVNRWLLIVRRRLAIELAQQRRTQAGLQSDATEVASLAVEVPTTDLETIGEQSRRLCHALLVLGGIVGLWFIWIDVLPALKFLDRFRLWTVTADSQTTHITLIHLIVALAIVLVTVLATRNIPGLLELSLLTRLPVNAGTRYAFTTICRYVVIIVGMIAAFKWLGISWGSYQWLVAAVTVGLGFGLQEIFANFVSGLILLFEQPVRVGDVVTIGDVTGVVSKIHMRATTVMNWDRHEFIVPNKDFITGRLLNWTLSNAINRVVVRVGVAYGSDPELVQRILLDVARDHPLIMKDPAPRVVFSEFSESSLSFVLNCFLPDLENRQAVVHELHAAAYRELKAAGIEFPFPRRELHIRSFPT